MKKYRLCAALYLLSCSLMAGTSVEELRARVNTALSVIKYTTDKQQRYMLLIPEKKSPLSVLTITYQVETKQLKLGSEPVSGDSQDIVNLLENRMQKLEDHG